MSTIATFVPILPSPSFVGGDLLGIKTEMRVTGMGANANNVNQIPQNFLTFKSALRMLGSVVLKDWTVVVIAIIKTATIDA